MRQGIFVSYRRSDTLSATGRLCDHLRGHGFSGGDDLFLDIDNIPPGADFRKVIHDTLQQCDVVLLVIGKSWLSATDAQGRRRLDSASDTHRFEVKSALDADVVVIPVLVEGAQHPAAEDLPDELADLAFRNSWEISDRRFAADASGLADHIRQIRARRIEPRPEASAPVPSDETSNDVVETPTVGSDAERSVMPPASSGAADPTAGAVTSVPASALRDHKKIWMAAAAVMAIGALVLVAVLSLGGESNQGAGGTQPSTDVSTASDVTVGSVTAPTSTMDSLELFAASFPNLEEFKCGDLQTFPSGSDYVVCDRGFYVGRLPAGTSTGDYVAGFTNVVSQVEWANASGQACGVEVEFDFGGGQFAIERLFTNGEVYLGHYAGSGFPADIEYADWLCPTSSG